VSPLASRCRCEGGYPYLAAKHAQEHGVALRRCFPDAPSAEAPRLRGRCEALSTNASCWARAAGYGYVGGYYGAGGERPMMEALLRGPIVASFFVRSDFLLRADTIEP
jgi:cathepsin C